MKLYTEADLMDFIDINGCIVQSDLEENQLTPIKIPSDEEIEKMRKEYIEHVNTMVHPDLERDGYLDIGFLAGAKNIIDKIQGGNK